VIEGGLSKTAQQFASSKPAKGRFRKAKVQGKPFWIGFARTHNHDFEVRSL